MELQRDDSEYWLGRLDEKDVKVLIEALSYYKLAMCSSYGTTDPEFAKEEMEKTGKADGMRKALLTPFAKGEIRR